MLRLVRWGLLLLIVGYVQQFAYTIANLVVGMPSGQPEWIGNDIVRFAGPGLIVGWAFVVTGTEVAPDHKPAVAWILVAIGVVQALVVLYMATSQKSYLLGLSGVSIVFGLLAGLVTVANRLPSKGT